MERSVEEILGGRVPEVFLLDCCMNFKTFFTELLGLEWTKHQEQIISAMEKYRKVVVEAPRQHGKTTLILAFILHKILFEEDRNILIVCNAFRQALDRMHDLRKMIRENPFLKELIPQGGDKIWSKTEITTNTGCRVVAKPNTENIRGGTYNYVMCDEIGQYEDKTIFWGVIQPTVAAVNGSIFAIGTPQTKVDLLADLLQPASPYVSLRFKALDKNNKPLWPERYPLSKLMEIKNSMPTLEWEREYMCNPISSEVSLFPYDMLLECFDSVAKFLYSKEPSTHYYAGFDAALSKDAKGSFSAWAIVDGGGRLVRLERAKGENFKAQFDRVVRLHKAFDVVKWTVDEGYVGKAFVQDMKDLGLPVEGFNFQGERKKDLYNKLRVELENRRIIIPRFTGSSETIRETDNLISELNSFIPTVTKNQRIIYESVAAHDDAADSFALAIWGKSGYGCFSWNII